MQVNFISIEELAQLLTDAERLQTIDHDGQLIHVLHYGGGDMLAVVNALTGAAVCIYPCASFDHEGGSVHDQARAMLGAEV